MNYIQVFSKNQLDSASLHLAVWLSPNTSFASRILTSKLDGYGLLSTIFLNDSQNLSRFLTVQLSMFFVLLSCDSLIILSNRCSFVKHFFIFLNSVLSSLSCDSLFILSKCFSFVKNFFHNFFNLFSKQYL